MKQGQKVPCSRFCYRLVAVKNWSQIQFSAWLFIFTLLYIHPTLALSFSKIPHKYPSIAKCILSDIQIQEMSSQLSVLMEDLQNPIQCLEVGEWHFWVSLSREEDGVFVNEVSLEVYRKIQSGPGKPSFAGTSIFLCLQWSEFHCFAHHKSHSHLSGKGHRQTHVWLLPHVSSENAVIF